MFKLTIQHFIPDVSLDHQTLTSIYRKSWFAAGFYFGLFAMINFSFGGKPEFHILLFLFFSMAFLSVALFFHSKKLSNTFKTILFYLLFIIIFNIGYLFEGGLLGPIPYLIFPFSLMVISLTNRSTTYQLLGFLLINLVGLIIYSYYHPEIFMESGHSFHYIERVLSHILSLIFTIFIIRVVLNEYIKDKARALSSEKNKGDFLANMSHLIRTPLNAINGYSQFINDTDISITERNSFKIRIHENAFELHRMINNLIDLAIINEDSLRFIYSPFTIGDLINGNDQNARLMLSKMDSSVQLITNFDDDILPKMIDHDYDRISQLIWNVLENAIENTLEGSIQIDYKLRDPQKELQVKIADTGVGMSQDKIQSLFNLINFSTETYHMANPKPGLGLNITKGILDQINGVIDISSKEGVGTSIVISIPNLKLI